MPGVSVMNPARAASDVRSSGTKTRSPAAVQRANPSGIPSRGFTLERLRALRHLRQGRPRCAHAHSLPKYARLASVQTIDGLAVRFERGLRPRNPLLGEV